MCIGRLCSHIYQNLIRWLLHMRYTICSYWIKLDSIIKVTHSIQYTILANKCNLLYVKEVTNSSETLSKILMCLVLAYSIHLWFFLTLAVTSSPTLLLPHFIILTVKQPPRKWFSMPMQHKATKIIKFYLSHLQEET